MIRFTEHAIERYVERVRPAVGRDDALRELTRLRDVGSVCPDAPAWYGGSDDIQDIAAWFIIGDVACPLVRSLDRRGPYLAVTTVVAGSIPETMREGRNRSRAGRGGKKRAVKLAQRNMSSRAVALRRTKQPREET